MQIGKGINQNKNPNIGLNMKNGIEIVPSTKNYERLSENLRNISNIINNPAIRPPVADFSIKPPVSISTSAAVVPSEKKSEEVWEKKYVMSMTGYNKPWK